MGRGADTLRSAINKDSTCKNLEVFIGDMLGIEKFSISHEDKKIGPVYDILKQEMNRARTLSCAATPVYPGFEAVNLPGICSAGLYFPSSAFRDLQVLKKILYIDPQGPRPAVHSLLIITKIQE